MSKSRYLPFAAFTAVFAVCAACVFWGAWSTAVGHIAPDDSFGFRLSYSDALLGWWNIFVTTGKAQPTDLFFSGLLVSPMFCSELKYVCGVYFAALGLAYFIRGRGLGPIAAYGAALLLAFSGYWLTLFSAGHAGWFIWMSYGLFAFGLIDRAIAGGRLRHWLLLGLVVSWAGFNQQDLWLLFTVFTAAYFVFRSIASRRFDWRGFSVAALVFFMVGLPNFIGIADIVKSRMHQIAIAKDPEADSKGPEVASGANTTPEERWEFVTNWSLPSDEVAEFVVPRLNGDTSCPFVLSINRAKGVRPYTGALGRPMNAPRGNYRQHSLYVGWVTVLLALAGAALGFRHRTVRFFAAAALVFFALSLGRYFEPAYRCVFALPAGDLIRCPVKWHHLTEFCLAVLAGYGLESLGGLLATRLPAAARRFVPYALAALVAVGLAGLVSNARLYCAPVDYSVALGSKCSSQLTVMPRQQFADAQVQKLVRARRILSVANWLGDPNVFLVQYLTPLAHEKPRAPEPLPLALGIVSSLSALAAIAFAVRKA